MLRSLAVLVFIGGMGSAAVYVARRPTIAKGSVIAADLLESNQGKVRSLTCDEHIEIGVHGAAFSCRAVFPNGATERLHFTMDRAGMIRPATEPRRVNKVDPWGD